MSTNYYLYDRRAIEAGVPLDRLVGVHVGKRHYGGLDVGVVYTLQAVGLNDWLESTRELGHFLPTPYVADTDFPDVASWSDWRKILMKDESWQLVDEYGTPISHDEFINWVQSQEDCTAAHVQHQEWCQMVHSRGDLSHYLSDDGYSFCTVEFS